MINPKAAKEEYLKRQKEKHDKAFIELEHFFDEQLAAGFSGDEVVVTRSKAYVNNIPWGDKIVEKLLTHYQRAGWDIEEKQTCDEQGIDRIFIFSESSSNNFFD